MVFDSLTHVTPDGRWFDSSLDASTGELLRQLDESGTRRAVVVGLPGYIENRFVLEVCERHPDRLVPCGSLNPAAFANPSQAQANLRAELKGRHYKGLKLHPRLNRYDPLDPRCVAVLEELAAWEHPLPVWLDTLLYYRGGSLKKPLVDTIHELVGRFPSLTFVLLHGGGSWILQLAEAIRDCPNAYLDISFTLQRYRTSSIAQDLRYLVDTFDRRVIFGSDFPEVPIGTALRTFDKITEGISSEKRLNVLGANLAKILHLEQS
ncbi:MAG TPA: amidohydrolase family protein [Candidatus Sulfotelmatobacter sp.]|jgi:predicted TIM-barrel fold metal-dependent hydrolase